MSIPTVDELVQEQSADTLLTQMLSSGASLGLATTSWADGSPTRTLLTIDANVLSSFSSVQVNIFKSGFLQYARGVWLTWLADQEYDIQRTEATYASGTVTLSNATGAAIVVANNSLHLLNSSTGATYLVTVGGTIPASGTLDVSVVADVAGTDSNAAAGEIDALVNAILGVTCTNADPVLGTDEQTDENLISLCESSVAKASPDGPKEIYDYVARTNTDVSSPITRTKVVTNLDTGEVTVYLANASGAPVAGDVTIIDDAIHDGAEPQCVSATAVAASNISQAVTYTAYVKDSSLTNAEIEQLIEDSLNAFAQSVPIGGYEISPGTRVIDKGSFERAIFDALPEIKTVTMGTPAADINPAIGEVLVLGTITPTITRF